MTTVTQLKETTDLAKITTMVSEMLTLQKNMNDTLIPGWMQNPPEYTRASYIELVECINHLDSWKWWKNSSPDVSQALMELVDVWHFYMSEEMVQYGGNEKELACTMACYVKNGYKNAHATSSKNLSEKELSDLRNECLDQLVAQAAAGDISDSFTLFFSLLATFCSFDEFYRLYVGKNVLNHIRQKNGYKNGTYIKIWNGEEDNVVLTRVIQAQPEGVALFDHVSIVMQDIYDTQVKPKAA